MKNTTLSLPKPRPGDCCVFCFYGSVPCPPVRTARGGHCDALRMNFALAGLVTFVLTAVFAMAGSEQPSC